MKTSLIIAGGLLGVAAAASLAISGLQAGPEDSARTTDTPGTAQATALTVAVATPQSDLWPRDIQASGWTAAWQEAVISSEVGGQRITALNYDVGDTVEEGAVLAELSRASLENDILELQASLDSVKAALEQATADADRARRLQQQGSGSISDQQINEYLMTERQARADVASAEAALASASLDLENTTLRAVSGGVISSRSATLGAGVSEGEELFRLIRDNRIEWQAEVPLRQTFGLKVGTPARIPTPIGDVTGKIRRIAPSASDTNGRVKVYVDIDQLPGDIEPKIGVMISGRFQTGEDSALHVPSSAVVLQDGFSYVFVLEDGDTVRRQRVETGRRQDNRVEITSDLGEDAQVVQSGGAFLTDGSRVRVTDAAPVETSALSAETPAETPETSAEGAAE